MKKQILYKALISFIFIISSMFQLATAQDDNSEPLAIEDYVHQYFLQGVPYEETVSQYDVTVVPKLLEMLKDPNEDDFFKANIVVVLGMVGDDSVVEPLIEFIEEPCDKDPSDPVYIAKTSAVISMGYLINRTGNEKALNYLAASLEPNVWMDRGTIQKTSFLPSTSDDGTTEESLEAVVDNLSKDLSKKAILGLALSGHPSVGEIFSSLEAPTTEASASMSESMVEFQAQVKGPDGILAEAISTYEQLVAAEDGEDSLIEYYQNQSLEE